MNAFLIVIGVNAAMVGFSLIFGGYLTLMAPSEEENEGMQGDYREALEKSWMHALWFSSNYAARARVSWLRIAVTHWPRRPGGAQVDLVRRDLSDYCGSSWILFRIVQFMIGG